MWRANVTFAINAAARRIVVAVTAVRTPRSNRIGSCTFLVGLLSGAGLTVQLHERPTSLNLCLSSSAGLRQVNNTQPDLVLAFTLYPVTVPVGQFAVLTGAFAVLIGFLVCEMDLVLEPLLVLVGIVFLWFAITRERRHADKAA